MACLPCPAMKHVLFFVWLPIWAVFCLVGWVVATGLAVFTLGWGDPDGL